MKSLVLSFVFGGLIVSFGLMNPWPPLGWTFLCIEWVLIAYSAYSGRQTGRKLNFLLEYRPDILQEVFKSWNEWHGNIHDVICFEKLLPEDFREEFKEAWRKYRV